MVYLNLMYRQKAEIDPDDETRQADLKLAEDWVNKALAARKAGTASGSSEACPLGCPVVRKLFRWSFRPDLSRPARSTTSPAFAFPPPIPACSPQRRGEAE